MNGSALADVPASSRGDEVLHPGSREPIRAELFGLEHLEAHARDLAASAGPGTATARRDLLARFEENARALVAAHRIIGDDYRQDQRLGPIAEWLLDNFHIISEALREIRTDLPTGYYQLLPRRSDGYPCIYTLALNLVAHCDSSLDESKITRVVQAYQSVAPLQIGELWAMPIMLRLVLIENLRRLADLIVEGRALQQRCRAWLAPLLRNDGENQALPKGLAPPDHCDLFLVHALELFREQHGGPAGADWLETLLEQRGSNTADLVRREQQRQAANQVSIGNSVTSLRLLSALDWSAFFEHTSQVEAILRQDPAGIYLRQDFPTRDRCRQIVEQLARGSRRNENDVAQVALTLATVATDHLQTPPYLRRQITYYLLDDGRLELENRIGYRTGWIERGRRFLLSNSRPLYFGGIVLTTVLIVAGTLWFASAAASINWWLALLIILAVLLPASELAIGLLNRLAVWLAPPRILPKLLFTEGIPADCATLVVMPAMLARPEAARALTERLESHFLSNPDPHLRFALLTDFADAPRERMPEDDSYVQAALQCIRILNQRHAPDGPDRFFLFHRRRQWNARQACWMGWERKRGKLSEFNRLLRGDQTTSYERLSGNPAALPRIRFVITLDADTQLPHETATRLIGTLAHPLNQPIFDAQQRRVTRGYGVLQPRVSFTLPGSRRSLFARVYSGSAGLDPYTTAVSDVYQDLFGIGSYIGKGIYDVDAFEAATGHAFPENHILSHDLIEGNHARCGLATDIEFLDDFPARYHVYVRREHRWIRGDWQILPWLLPRVPTGNGVAANTLPFVERWKIFDNLRRSLLSPALVLLLILGWTVLPGSPWFWTGLALLVLTWPLWMHGIGLLGQFVSNRRLLPGEWRLTAGQVCLSTVFLLDQARHALDAVGRTLYRLLISRRHLLEWETAATTERRLNGSFGEFVGSMWPVSLAAGVLIALVGWWRPEALPAALPLLLAWLASPAVAYWVSRQQVHAPPRVLPEDRQLFRRLARKTWRFFEEYVTAADHWLPPDNYQQEPKGVIAHRTSPTNIGLYLVSTLAAHDLGYLGLGALIERLEKTFATLDQLERNHGHFYNWYDTQSLQPLLPIYLSTVDSGNLLASLLTLHHGVHEKLKEVFPPPQASQGLADILTLLQEQARALPIETERQTLEEMVAHAGRLAGHDWLPWLQRCAELASGLSSEPQSRWVAALRTQVNDLQRDTAAFMPWLELLRQSEARLGDGDAALQARWRGLAERLAQPASVTDIDAKSAQWLAELEELASIWPSQAGQEQLARLSLAVKQQGAGALLHRGRALAARAMQFTREMDFKILYNERRDLFSVGYNLSQGRLDNAHYDLLASEASLTSFLAVARGDVPKRHWFQLSRPMTGAAGRIGLLSWGGTMFEYLMPRLFLRYLPDTLIDESQRTAIARQIEYGRERRVPWGISESAFSAVDAELNYQYQAFGAPGLGLKRGLGKELVLAPYATALAVPIAPAAAAANFRSLTQEGGEGELGYFEALDYTAERMPPHKRLVVVQCYMAHHQAMTLIALVNCLLDQPMQRRLVAEPMVRAAELLLQERLPVAAPLVNPPSEHAMAASAGELDSLLLSRRLTTPHTSHPRTHIVSNGQYSTLITNSGAGRSWCRGLDINRWREDATCDNAGQFIYIKDLKTQATWSAGYQPTRKEADEYEVIYSTDKAEIRRVDGLVETRLEVTVSPDSQAEVRRLTLTNHGPKSKYLEVTSYQEVVLAAHGADLAHPAFQKLFLETELVASDEALLCRRRPRSAQEEPVWGVHVLAVDGETVGDLQYETDRARFIGRGRSLDFPLGVEHHLTGTLGAVLDPIFSLRRQVRVPRDSSVSLAFTTAVAASRAEALALADQFHDFPNVNRALELAWAQSQVELRHLQISAEDAHLFQRLAAHVVFASGAFRAPPAIIAANLQGQAILWRLGISGDHPIVLVAVTDLEQFGLVRQLIAAHSYWRLKGLMVDLVILNNQAGGYFDEIQPQLLNLLRISEVRSVMDKPGGIFVRKASLIAPEDQHLLRATARCVLMGSQGSLGNQIERLERSAAPVQRPPQSRRLASMGELASPRDSALRFANPHGGFSADGREYVIQLRNGQRPPAPWVNVIANPSFGCLVSEQGGGCTWAGNSQTNRLTSWRNDPVSDLPSEVIYLRDEATGAVWTPVPFPRRLGDFTVRHGQGYTVFQHAEHALEHELAVFVATDEPVKFYRLKLRNPGRGPRRLTATFHAEWVLGASRDLGAMNIVTTMDPDCHALVARNPWGADFNNCLAFAASSLPLQSFSGDRGAFLGRNGSLELPSAMTDHFLNDKVGAALDPCAALQVEVDIPAGEEREVVFMIGQADAIDQVRRLVTHFRRGENVLDAFKAVTSHWDQVLGTVQVRTPNAALDLLLNRWLLYQVLSCRIWGRTALYQSGGAYGFRDQLQDVLALLHARPHEARAHILLAASRQFSAGDVQHWWHPPSGAGVRTRFSDDFLWLPYAVSQYITHTGDHAILDEVVPFLKAPALRPEQEEDYRIPEVSEETASLYEHCLRAIRHGMRLGAHGLPLMGTGDWNDGMNRVGVGGQGESVWNAWFQLAILRDFIPLVRQRGDDIAWLEAHQEALRAAVESQGWDGDWYRRAYFDDGTPLGSASNEECRIDSLTQSWSVISGAGDPQRSRQALMAVDEHLVRAAQRLILLFAPPFDQSPRDPGYIKGYVPGIRENGGQYTHAAIWTVQANALLGRHDHALKLLDLLNPILQTDLNRYRVEPYVLAGDVYSLPPHTGRGGWTWYTGSAGWFYRVALETILGFERHGNRLAIRPRIPASWPGFEITYRHGSARYQIQVQRGAAAQVHVDGEAMADDWVELRDDNATHLVTVTLGPIDSDARDAQND